MAVEPEHRSILAVDIEAFSDPARTNPARLRLHRHLLRLLPDLLARAGIPPAQSASSDTGDGLVVTVAPQVCTVRLLDPLIPRLTRQLATFNRDKPPPQRMRLRVALHVGGVLADPQPLHGEAVIHACQLLDSQVARACLTATAQPLVVIASHVIYDEVIKHGYRQIDPATWHPVIAQVKQTHAPAWVHVPGDPDAPRRANVITPHPPSEHRVGPAPRELPGPPAEFTGRHQELGRIHELLSQAAGQTPRMVVAIDGLGGVGKSTLAVEAARRLADQFPDGQLYLDLHGSTIGLDPLTPLQALARLLGSLGVDPKALPTEVEEAAARFRTLTSDRRLLIVLDNARDAAQVRPLLPGHPGCAVVITSRDTLAFLEGVTRLPLDVLPQPQALALLGRLAGHHRVQADPEAATRLVQACGLLPLAIQISGRRLATRPSWSLDDYTTQLADQRHRLSQLQFGDRAVRSSFQLSYQLLGERDPQATWALRLLSLLDGPDVTVPVAAALLDQSTGQTQAILEDLVDASLLTTLHPDRYRLHDLLRLFAREHATRQHPNAEQTAALGRAIGFSTATVWHTLALLRPGDWRLGTTDPSMTAGGLRFPDAPAALAWLETERANLLAAISQAANSGQATLAGLASQLTRALFVFFDLRSHWQDGIQANQTILALGRQTPDSAVQAHAANDLGVFSNRVGRYTEALTHHQQALTLFHQLGDRQSQAFSLTNLGAAYDRVGQPAEAISCHQEALTTFQNLSDRQGQASSLGNLGLVYNRVGRHAEALTCQQEALTLFRQLGDRRSQAWSLSNLGAAYRQLERYTEAIGCHREALIICQNLGDRWHQAVNLSRLGVIYDRTGRSTQALTHHQEALTLFRQLGDRHGHATTLRDLGDTLQAAGRHDQARAAWQEALTIYETLQLPEADELHDRLTIPPPGEL